MFRILIPIALLASAYALDARADDNPYHPGSAAVVAPIDPVLYCVKGEAIPAWTCSQELSVSSGQDKFDKGFPRTEPQRAPKCEHPPA